MVEVILFCVVVVGVIALGIWKSRDPEETEEEKKAKGASDYFLAGRGLTWWLVGFSLIAANISTEQFVGMSGKSANWVGMAIAGYEWLAAITLVGSVQAQAFNPPTNTYTVAQKAMITQPTVMLPKSMPMAEYPVKNTEITLAPA